MKAIWARRAARRSTAFVVESLVSFKRIAIRVQSQLRIRLCILVALILATRCAESRAQAPFADRFAEWVSSDVRSLLWDRHTHQIRLSVLPEYVEQSNVRAGFHSAFANSTRQSQWVQIDLGRVLPIDSIALVPVSIVQESVLQNGYAFPVRFRVQVSIDSQFQQSSLIADKTEEDYPNPGKYPCQFTGLNVSGRFVRVTATKLAEVGVSPCFALGELIVISEDRNVATWRPVTSSSESIEAESRWSMQYLVDEQSILPLPNGLEPSHSNGYLSKPSETAEVEKWIQLDLGREYLIEELRLIPARPAERADIPGWGIPERFRVDVAKLSDFSDAIPYCDFSQVDVKHGVNHALVLPGELREDFSRGDVPPAAGKRVAFPSALIKARYVRLTTTKLDSRVQPTVLALAEFQVWSQGENVARGSKVTALDAAGPEYGMRWSREFLVDNCSSRRRLLPVVDWLAQIDRRQLFEGRLHETNDELRNQTELVWSRAQWGGAAVVTLVSLFTGLIIWLQQRRHRTLTESLRVQIASDLHDDIGSNLGTIALLCQTFGTREGISLDVASNLGEIRNIALETSDAMRDILWLMRASATGLDEFIGRMRTMTTRMTSGFEVQFEAPEVIPQNTVPLGWRRHVFLAFKESLYNAVRHSRAKCFVVSVRVDGQMFEISVTDNGTGFAESISTTGYGMGNLSRRLELLKGTVEVISTPGSGATIRLRAPLPKSRS